MKNFILLIIIVVAAAYAYRWYQEQHAPPVVVEQATPVPVVRPATPMQPRSSIQGGSGLQTHSLSTGMNRTGTPAPRRALDTPMRAPR